MFTLQERRKSRINRYFFFMLGFSPLYPMLRRANWCTTFKFVYYVYRQLSQLFINFFFVHSILRWQLKLLLCCWTHDRDSQEKKEKPPTAWSGAKRKNHFSKYQYHITPRDGERLWLASCVWMDLMRYCIVSNLWRIHKSLGDAREIWRANKPLLSIRYLITLLSMFLCEFEFGHFSAVERERSDNGRTAMGGGEELRFKLEWVEW